MYFLLSGEGPSDIGAGVCPGICEGANFRPGPMAAVVDRLVERKHQYSILYFQAAGFVSEAFLSARAKLLKWSRKSLQLPGKKRAKETQYYFNSARALAAIARELAAKKEDVVVPILFRDSDGTASAGRGDWADKRQSMLDGFLEQGEDRGVPMIPKPKSDAWLLCATKQVAYENCGAIENESGNDASPNNLKSQLSASLPNQCDAARLVAWIMEATVDVARIEMPSFRAFRDRLEAVIG